jgi:hypothetical protein
MIPYCDDRQAEQAGRMRAAWEGLEPLPLPQSRALPERDIRAYGPLLASGLLFFEQATAIYNDSIKGTGVDIYAGQSPVAANGLPKHDWKLKDKPNQKTESHVRRNSAKTGGEWEDVETPSESGKSVCRFQRRVLNGEVVEMRGMFDVPYLFAEPITPSLTDDEQKQLQKERAAKARAGKGQHDKHTPRFGFCKTEGCENRTRRRLLLRSLCPSCRGVIDTANPDGTMTVAAGGPVRMTKAEERRQRVLAAKQDNPRASLMELSRLTDISKSVIGRMLKEIV